MKSITLLAAAMVATCVGAFSTTNKPAFTPFAPTTTVSDDSRRSFLTGGAAALIAASAVVSTPPPAEAANLGDPNSVVGREIRSFNDLIYNFKNTALNGGLDASTLNEPSISFIEFGEKMKNGQVQLVEFYAPSGNVAYATIKTDAKASKKGGDDKKGSKSVASAGGGGTQRLRIGQGYPIEGKDSWSSPAYVIRSVSNFGVPYKFVVPALDKYKK